MVVFRKGQVSNLTMLSMDAYLNQFEESSVPSLLIEFQVYSKIGRHI